MFQIFKHDQRLFLRLVLRREALRPARICIGVMPNLRVDEPIFRNNVGG